MMTHRPVVETAYGPVRGIDDGRRCPGRASVTAPPVGELRFRAPQPPEPWNEPFDATAFGPVCPQPSVLNFHSTSVPRRMRTAWVSTSGRHRAPSRVTANR